MPHQRILSLTGVLFVALALIWGSSFLLIKVALESFSPGQVAIGRILIGAVTLVALMTFSRRRWPRDRRLWGHLAVVAVFLCIVPFLLFAWAGQFLPSGLSAILNATTPIWTVLFVGLAVRSERFAGLQVLGIVLGAVGVATVMGLWRVVADAQFVASLPAQAACLGATACYGIGFAWLRRFVLTSTARHDAVTIASVQMTLAAVMGLLLVPLVALDPLRIEPVPLVALLALGAFGTGLAYVWSTRVVVEWGPLAGSTVTYVTPVVGVVLGILVLGERLEWYQPVGAAVVLISVILVQQHARLSAALRRRRAVRAP